MKSKHRSSLINATTFLLGASFLLPLSGHLQANEYFNKKEKYLYYKWVDENGRTHYSQSLPKDVNEDDITRVKASGSVSSDAEKAKEKLEKRRKARARTEEQQNNDALEKEQADIEAKNKETIKANCEIARSNIDRLNVSARTRIRNAEGEYEYLTQETRDAEIKKNREYIKKNCKE